MKIHVVGAGFTGLTLAYYLKKQGVLVEIFEQQERVGGLISTRVQEGFLVESAANAILACPEIEQISADLGLPFLETQRASRKRYIFARGRKRRWPLTGRGTLELVFRWAVSWLLRAHRPKEGETLAEWGRRCLGSEAVEFLLEPGLRGIYASRPENMSAALVLRRFFVRSSRSSSIWSYLFSGLLFWKKKERRPLRGSLSPEKGMGSLIEALRERLEQGGVPVSAGSSYQLGRVASTKGESESPQKIIFCGRLCHLKEFVEDQTEELLRGHWLASRKLHHRLVAALNACSELNLVSQTRVQSSREEPLLGGFGCLFPRSEEFNSLGVLENTSIFSGRSEQGTSMTWILGGISQPEIIEWRDEQIQKAISEDQRRLFGGAVQERVLTSSSWPQALPNYDFALEELNLILDEIETQGRLFFRGNYRRGLGLKQILQGNFDLARKLVTPSPQQREDVNL